MKYLIVDDERLARTELIRQLNEILPSVEYHEAATVRDARGILVSTPIDAVFLDLEMPKEHGFDFIPELRAAGKSVVVTTAHERFALQAFEHEVVDYLLKPIDRKRLGIAVSKLNRISNTPREEIVVFADSGNCWPVRIDDILAIEASGSYVTLYCSDSKPITLSRHLKEIEELLGGKNFVRANRAQIVRLSALKAIRRTPGGQLLSEVEGVGLIEFSRRQSQAFRQRYGF